MIQNLEITKGEKRMADGKRRYKVLDNNNINSISIMNLNSHKAWIEIKDYTIIVFGLVLYAFGWTSFLLTNEITTGGIAGVSALIFFGTKIPVAISYFTLNALLLIAAIRILGIQFCIRTIFSVIVMTLLLSFFGMYIKEPLITGITVVVASLAFAVNVKSTSMKKKDLEYQVKEASLIKQKTQEEERAKELEAYRVYVQTKQYIEQVAKEKLGLVNPDEILLKPSEKKE